ncbi:MAG TPA: type II toxin-antitoxin system VapC family toxin [Usitatibacter sp.]|jgi:predicted nucleic-acid-binding protein|nr:type II toxin-antitoxin system VapC family toxin [Usitatibacter sp.]
MPAVDTNVLVRLLARDDPKQVRSAEAFVQEGAWVSLLALAETTWVLASAYDLAPGRIASGIEMLLDHKQLVLQDRASVAAALDSFRKHPKLGFTDCLMVEVARAAGHAPLGTFDKDLAKVEGAVRL